MCGDQFGRDSLNFGFEVRHYRLVGGSEGLEGCFRSFGSGGDLILEFEGKGIYLLVVFGRGL